MSMASSVYLLSGMSSMLYNFMLKVHPFVQFVYQRCEL